MPTPEELTIPDKLDSINVTKQAIRQAIVDKGVEVPEGTTFYEYAGKIGEIQTGGGLETIKINVYAGQKPAMMMPGHQIDMEYIELLDQGSYIEKDTILADSVGSSYDLYTYTTLKGVAFSVSRDGMTFSKYNGDLHAVNHFGDTVEDVTSGTMFYAMSDVDFYFDYA